MTDHPHLKEPCWAAVRSKCRECGCVINRIADMQRERPEELPCFVCKARTSWCWDLIDGPLHGWLLVDDWLYADAEDMPMPRGRDE